MKVIIDPNNKQQREMVINAVSKTIGKVIRDNCDMNRAFHIEDMETIESVMKRQEEIIEEQEERISIMSEGGWHKITESTESLPKETDSVDVWVYGEDENGNPIVFRAIYSRWHFYDVSGRLVKECKITHWMYNKEPEPPKEGEPG